MKKRKKSQLIILLIIVLAVICKLFIFDIFIVKGDSMFPAIKNGDIVFAFKLFDKFEKQDIIVIKKDNGYIIKRIAATEGDMVKECFSDNKLYINNSEIENYIINNDTDIVYNLKQNEYYVLGDNYLCSVDSRYFGLITNEEIIGLIIH